MTVEMVLPTILYILGAILLVTLKKSFIYQSP